MQLLSSVKCRAAQLSGPHRRTLRSWGSPKTWKSNYARRCTCVGQRVTLVLPNRARCSICVFSYLFLCSVCWLPPSPIALNPCRQNILQVLAGDPSGPPWCQRQSRKCAENLLFVNDPLEKQTPPTPTPSPPPPHHLLPSVNSR